MKRLLIVIGIGILLLALMVSLPVFAASEDGTRDAITATPLANTGVTQSLSASSGDGHSFTNTGRQFILVTNDYTDTVTMTVVTGGTVSGLAIADVDVTLTAGQTKLVGPFSSSVFNQSSSTDVYINFDSAVTGTVASSVTLAIFSMQ